MLDQVVQLGMALVEQPETNVEEVVIVGADNQRGGEFVNSDSSAKNYGQWRFVNGEFVSADAGAGEATVYRAVLMTGGGVGWYRIYGEGRPKKPRFGEKKGAISLKFQDILQIYLQLL